MRGMARRVWLAGWASHRLELTATSPLIDLCTPVGKHTRGRPGKSRSCDGQGRRSVVTDKAGDHVTQHDARPALARSAPTHQAPVGYSPRGVSARAFFVRDLIRSRGGFRPKSAISGVGPKRGEKIARLGDSGQQTFAYHKHQNRDRRVSGCISRSGIGLWKTGL